MSTGKSCLVGKKVGMASLKGNYTDNIDHSYNWRIHVKVVKVRTKLVLVPVIVSGVLLCSKSSGAKTGLALTSAPLFIQ